MCACLVGVGVGVAEVGVDDCKRAAMRVRNKMMVGFDNGRNGKSKCDNGEGDLYGVEGSCSNVTAKSWPYKKRYEIMDKEGDHSCGEQLNERYARKLGCGTKRRHVRIM